MIDMTFTIRSAIADGIDVATSRAGALVGLLLALLAGLLSKPSLSWLETTLGLDFETATGVALAAGLGTAAVLFGAALTVVAIRTFVGDTQGGGLPASVFEHLPAASLRLVLANLLVGVLTLLPFALLAGVAVGVGDTGGDVTTLEFENLSTLLLVGATAVTTALVYAFLWISMLFVAHEIAVEGTGTLAAIKNSWALTSGHRLRLAGLVLVVSVGLSVATSGFGLFGLLLPVPAVVPQPLLQAATMTVSLAILARSYRQLAEPTGSIS